MEVVREKSGEEHGSAGLELELGDVCTGKGKERLGTVEDNVFESIRSRRSKAAIKYQCQKIRSHIILSLLTQIVFDISVTAATGDRRLDGTEISSMQPRIYFLGGGGVSGYFIAHACALRN